MKKLILLIALFPFLLKSQSLLETEFLKQLNSYRDSLGLSKLEYDSNLSIATKHHSDYLELVQKNGDSIFKSSISHDQSIDLPGFNEIMSCDDRVSLLTNFKIAKRYKTKSINKELYSLGEVITKLKLSRIGNDGTRFPSGDLYKDRYFIAYKALENFKKSEGHNFVITDPGEIGMKVGISIKEGKTPNEQLVVMIYGYPKK